MYDNSMKIEFVSKSQNESFARVAVAAFVSQLDPTIDELTDVKTAVSEAVTNSIIHGYENGKGIVKIEAYIKERELTLIIEDEGAGIEDVNLAMQPLYTSRPDLERSGMGFTVMDTFMDSLEIQSEKNKGTRVLMKKVFKSLS
ncbi:anti-sigma F factor [Clostridium tyrobutyricum]|jgi:stage II sporulation protein AB (anti-sigma F factor)|uniref:Anti-sigma F factor n=1 Tax=Clostridium tyrobutyricum DIVETGP TaxID=1408889 RepID=W6NF52_CLOTY|nr:anti-sigma F factor [Clostridium tyrobutyricum]AND84146.1 anti-sigma F factor [Clostridium tyrobutyricum]ANP68872.1 anti-sigma F factor [Clostridium tyrobutyricum]MBR9649132.1 anti-sigma F factor [Clostridium tyrobutyricum]MBV4415871.1 anti-sigma F factor [Clostridium tyrobutyricum]MBV4421864.1 anti-sigma F factor [Clostridium tyrobutyricum]